MKLYTWCLFVQFLTIIDALIMDNDYQMRTSIIGLTLFLILHSAVVRYSYLPNKRVYTPI